jgi:parvulin-like peptidyl-prolyl isomerase
MSCIKRWARGPIALCVCLASFGCRPENAGSSAGGSADAAQVAVRVANKAYSHAELEDFFSSRLDEFPDPVEADRVKSALLETFIEEKLLLAEAERRGVTVDPRSVNALLDSAAEEPAPEQSGAEAAALKGRVEESLKVQQYVNEYVLKDLRVTEEECRKYYEEHLADFIRNDVVHAREILVSDEALAKNIQALLKTGRNRNFAELARLHSKAPSASYGGDMGRFQRGELPPRLERAIFGLAPGTVSRTVVTEFGYHIFFIEEKIPAHQQKFYEARKEIEDRLRLERQRNAIENELASLAQRIPVQIYRNNLGFNYAGTRYSPRGGSNP